METQPSWRRRAARLAALGLAAGGLVALPVLPAQADTFTPNNVPTVSVAADAVAFTYTSGSAFNSRIVAVTFGDGDTISDVATVSICMYKTAGDSTCATPNPQTNMKLTWTNSDAATVQNTGTEYAYATSTPANVNWGKASSTLSAVYAATATSATVNFSVQPSVVASLGQWNIKATVTDRAATPASGTHNPGASVWTPSMPYYSSHTARAGLAFGQVNTGASATSENQGSGTALVTNATSTMNFAAGTFSGTGGGAAVPQDLSNAGGLLDAAPATNTFALQCGIGATYAGASGKARILATATAISTAQATSGTVEAGVTPSNSSCQLTNGGSNSRRLVTGTITSTYTQT